MIIGLGYRARSGKDTVATMLREGRGFHIHAFADALKAACAVIFGLDESQLRGDRKEMIDGFWHDTPRRILQVVGTECLRKGYRDDVWIQALERRIQGLADVVVPDVRFPNEAEAIKRWGGMVVRVDRPGSGASGGVVGHASEQALDNYTGWDRIIVNDGTLEDLRACVDQLP